MKILRSIKSLINKILDKWNPIFLTIHDITLKKIIIFCVIIIVFGYIANRITPYPLFYFHQIWLIFIFLISLYSVKSFLSIFDDDNNIKGDQILSIQYSQTKKNMKSSKCFVMAIIVVIFYFTNIVLLKYIEINAVGIYAIFLGSLSLFTAIIGYYQFVQLVVHIKALTKINITKYNKYIPANTPWLVELAETASKFRNIFLLLGLMFTIEYAILIPDGAIHFKSPFSININNKIPFIITWLGILVFIVLAFPLFNYLIKVYLKKIVQNLKLKTIHEFERMLDIELNKIHPYELESFALERISAYASLISEVDNSHSYPIKDSTSLISIILSLTTIAVHVTSIISNISIPGSQ